MSQEKVYLCPSCQAIVKSEKDTPEGLVCHECGFEFGGSGGVEEDSTPKKVNVAKAVIGSASLVKDTIVRDVIKQRRGGGRRSEAQPSSVHEMALGEGTELEHAEIPPGEDEVVLKDGTRMVRRKRRKKEKDKHRKLYFFITLWLGIAAAIIVVVQLNKESEGGKAGGGDSVEEEKGQKEIFLRRHMPAISQNFARFIMATEDDARIQEIDFSSRLASNFSIFHQSKSIPIPTGRFTPVQRNLMVIQKDPFAPAVEVLWRDEGGKLFESVHVWNGKDWKLDWEHFSRYCSAPWTLFRSKLGQKEGEFRLLMRKRQVLRESSYYSLLFYEEPSLESEDRRKSLEASESEEVIVKIRTELGDRLTKLFQEKEEDLHHYETILGSEDPDLMIRVCAVLAWEKDEDGDDVLELKDFTGISWYGTRICRAYRQEQKLKESESEDPVVPESAIKKQPTKR